MPKTQRKQPKNTRLQSKPFSGCKKGIKASMNKKFVKIVAIILAVLMVASVGYVLFAVVAGMAQAAAAAPLVSASVIKAAAPLLLAA
jgi:hypothetical protein